jgi:tetratricopeptide (TPR) repeat protein
MRLQPPHPTVVGQVVSAQTQCPPPEGSDYLNRARECFRCNDLRGTIRFAETELRVQPGSCQAHLLLAEAEYAIGDYNAAWYDLQKVILSDELRADLPYMMGLQDVISVGISLDYNKRKKRARELEARRSQPD